MDRTGQPTSAAYSTAAISQSPGFSMDGLDLEAPIATLRSLAALSKDTAPSASQFLDSNDGTSTNSGAHYSKYDPISRGILTVYDAQRAIQMSVGFREQFS